MLSDIAGDVKRCVDSHMNFVEGKSTKDYSEFWLNRVELECQKEINPSVLPEFLDEIDEIRKFLSGERDRDYILRYWKQYESTDEAIHI